MGAKSLLPGPIHSRSHRGKGGALGVALYMSIYGQETK